MGEFIKDFNAKLPAKQRRKTPNTFGDPLHTYIRSGCLYNSAKRQVLEHPPLQEADSMNIVPPVEDIGNPTNISFHADVVVTPETYVYSGDWNDVNIEIETNSFDKKRNWTAYNNAQMQEGELFDVLLRELVETVEEPIQVGPGRRNLPIADQLYCAVKKVYS